MKKSDFYYELPQERIAQTPVEPRDSSRLLVYNRANDAVEHKIFRDIVEYLQKGDVLVINNTKVIPARLFAKRKGFDGICEVLLLRRLNYTCWEAITKPARKLKIGTELVFSQELTGVVKEYKEDGIRIIEFSFNGVFEDVLDRVGSMPLPPYIHEKLQDKSRYQTVYCKTQGSAAAPTAGLHFTNELLQTLKEKGVIISEILLHVGLSTFRPVKEEEVERHKMHSEYYEISSSSANEINDAIKQGRRIIAVGTTSVRTLESASDEEGFVRAGCSNTEIFIYPGYRFKTVKGIITNFHLPESTLIMLISAFIGREKTLQIYQTAVDEKYRFFSFGDAMFIE